MASLIHLIQTSKLIRFLVLFSFSAGLYLMFSLLNHILHGGEIEWKLALILGMCAGVVNAFWPPEWWANRLKGGNAQ